MNAFSYHPTMPEALVDVVRPCCCASSSEDRPALPPPVSGRFDLVDHFGRAVNEGSFGAKHLLVFFGFSHCAVVCPRELSKLGRALAMLGSLAEQLQALYVSVDPARDTPEVLCQYLKGYGWGAGGFLGLTGSQVQVEAAKKCFRVFASRTEDPGAPGGYVISHTAISFLMAPGGGYRTHFAESLDASSVAVRLKALLQGKGQ
jgi:protein SCO1/2